jgi:arginase
MTNRRALMTIGLLGIPFDGNSSYLRGAALAPPAIREALRSGSSNLWTEDGVDLGEAKAFADAGDLTLSEDPAQAFEEIEAGVRAALGRSQPLICLGGDHSITHPIIKAFHPHYRDLTILHFDAHPDLYDELDGSRLSHACQFARIMEEGLVRRLVQIGIRTLNAHQRAQAERFGVEVITMRKLAKLSRLDLEGPLFISFDLDVLDPAFAPGVSHYEPGGMSVREVLSVIQSLRVYVVGADIVEYNPARDRQAQSAMVCVKILKEIAAAMLRRGAEPAAGWP